MIFNMVGGSGSAALDFKVVGGTSAPSSPTENTVWVNTDTEITSWIFSAAEPETTAEGLVWIQTGSSSPVSFNALKKNGITVYPISAKQFVNGNWVSVDASTYQNGAWNSWIVYLFKKNDQCIDLTGGWVKGSDVGLAPYYGNGGSQSIGDTMSLHWAQIDGTAYHGAAYYVTKNKIDLTDATSLKITCSVAGYVNHCRGGVSSYSQKPWGDQSPDWAHCAAWKNLTNGTVSIDVSSLTGGHYVMVGGSTYDTVYDPGWLTVTSISIE
jgi:hypothetical protein